MKKWILCLVVLAGLLFAGGCDPAAQKAEQGFYENLTEAVNSGIDAQQKATSDIIVALKDSQALPQEKLTKIEAKINEVDSVIDVVQTAAEEAARVYEEKRQEDKVLAAIEALQAGNTASAPINPYSPLISAILGVAAAAAGGYSQIKRKELSTVSKKYEAHKRGAEAIMRESSAEDARKIYDTIGQEREKLGL
ncbi:MAG: hypothetical protein ACYSSI_04935 [Planctomycetota bacterium]